MSKKFEPYYLKTFERHEADLASVRSGEKTNIRFNKKMGEAYVLVVENLKHYKGELAGEFIVLEDWQKKVLVIMGGWERKNTRGQWIRRFRTCFIYLPRKNGKTLFASAFSIADSVIRPEQGGETAFFATKKDQAKLAYSATLYMLKNNKDLAKYTKEVYKIIKFTDSEFYCVGRDSNTLDGLNVSIGVCDEHHAHSDDSVWDVIKSSQTARLQPLMLSITTAGFNLASPAKALYDYAKVVLEGVIKDDTFFAFIAEAPVLEKKDFELYFTEEIWRIANPNYGISLKIEEFESAAKEARERPEKLNNFLVKYLNVWVNASQAYLPIAEWSLCKGEVQKSGKYVGGLDLSIRDDFSAFAKIYEIDKKYHIHIKLYAPSERLDERERELKAPLRAWADRGYLTVTEGNSIDYKTILEDVAENINEMEAFCYDPYNARYIVSELGSLGFDNTYPVRQGFLSLSEATAFLLKLIRDKMIVHEGNPVLDWMISNLSVISDSTGNIKPDKTNPNNKIDGVASIITALAYLVQKKIEESLYETQGLRGL